MVRIAWHLGLGDAICCAAIIAKKAMDNDEVHVPCWKHNEVSVKSLFVDMPNVKVFIVDDDHDFVDYEFKLGFYNWGLPQYVDEDFVEWFYRQAGMTIEDKKKYCPINKAVKRPIIDFGVRQVENFVHDDESRSFNIYGVKDAYRPEAKDVSILSHALLLMKAKNIHCIDSSFYHLCEALPVEGKLFYHKYARPRSTKFNSIKNWTVIE